MDDNLLLDKRLIPRHIKQGLVARDRVEAHIAGLPDLTEVVGRFESKLDSVGVSAVERKDTGETDDD